MSKEAKEFLKRRGVKNPPIDSGISGGGDAPRYYVSDAMQDFAIAGIEAALKKVKALAEQQQIERPMGDEDSAYNAGIIDLVGSIGFIDPAAILREMKGGEGE